jgi:hypothetical protein
MVELLLAADVLFGIRLGIAEMGRSYFKKQGWYAEHRPFQAVLSAVMFAAMGVLAWVIWRRSVAGRKSSPGCHLAIAGAQVSLLPFFIACISMHFFEDLLAWPVWWMGLGALMRAGGSLMTGLGAWHFLKRSRITSVSTST